MPRLVPIDNIDEETPKKLRLVPVEKKEMGARLVPVQPVKPERTKLDQPLLKEVNATSVKNVPEAVLLAAKGMVVDFPLGMGAFIGGATYDAYDALLKGKYSFENARKAHEYMTTASHAAYSKVRELVPLGDAEGAEQIINNLFTPLEKFATKGGEIVTDLFDSAEAGATAYGTLQILPWLLGFKAAGMGIGGAKGIVKGVTQKNLAPMMAAFREKGLDVPVKINPKQPMLDAKAELFGVLSERMKQLEKMAQEKPAEGQQQQPNPELQKAVQEIQTLKEVNDSLGVVNAGEIPEGKVVDLKPATTVGGKTVKIAGQEVSVDEIFKKTEHGKIVSVEARPNSKFSIVTMEDGFKYETMSPPTPVKIVEPKPVAMADTQFTATNNIKEHQKSLKIAKEEIVQMTVDKRAEYLVDRSNQRLKKAGLGEATEAERKGNIEYIKQFLPKDKGARRNLIKERAEAAKAARLKEIEELSHYEEAPDPLTVDTNKIIQDTLYKEFEGIAKPVTLQSIKELSTKNELGVNANVGANGDMVISVTDKHGNKADFILDKGGNTTLQHVHDFVNNWTDDFAQVMKKQYEIKSEVIDNAAELIKMTGPTKKHVTKAGEVIEYQTVGDLKMAYEQRGLPWKGSKKQYYKAKKIDELAKAEIDDKLTPLSQKSLPQIELLDSQGNGKKPGILSWVEPFRHVAQDIEQRTGFPMQQFESKIRDGMRQVNSSIVPYQKRLLSARGGRAINPMNIGEHMNHESAVRIYKALENPVFRESGGNFNTFKKSVATDKDLKGMLGSMTEKEYNSAGKIRNILTDAAEEFNVPIDKMVLDYAPRMMREGVSGWTEAVKKWQLPEEYKWAALEERSGYMRPHEENIFKVVDTYLRRGATKRYVGNYLEELNKKINDPNLKFESKADREQIQKYVATMRGWQTGFDESIRTTGETIARILNKAINAPFKMVGGEGSQRYRNISYRKIDVEKKMIDPETGKMEIETIPRYIKTAEEPGFFDIHSAANDFVNAHLKLSYSGALAFRPMVYMRDLYQSQLALPLVGPRWFAKGMKEITSKEAWNESKAATVLFEESPVAAGELSRGWTIIDDLTQASTWSARAGNNMARHVIYHGGKKKSVFYGEKFLENIKNGMKEDTAISKYINDSGSDFFHPVLLKNEIVPLLKARDITSLSERTGFHFVAETQWLYERGQAPYWARSTAGRVLGQFGMWPSWYLKYVRNLATRGSKWNRTKRLAGLATVNAITYEVGKEIFGVDISNWMPHSPFSWFPLPVAAWDAARKVGMGLSDYEEEKGMAALENTVGIHIPGYLAVRSVFKGMEETRDEDKLKVMLGFKVAEEE